MKQPAAIIYQVTNLVNGKSYIGLTRFTLQKRWREHCYNAKSGLKTYFYAALRKYGPENFLVIPIASCLDVSGASEVERSVIKTFHPAYNQTNGGEFTVGRRVAREIVERIKAKNTGLKRTSAQNAANSRQAKARYDTNPEYRSKIQASLEKARASCDPGKRIAAVRAALTGRRMREDVRVHLSQVRMGMRHRQDVIDRIAKKHKKPVECITLGVTFDSALEAAIHLGISNSAIGKACAGKTQKTAGGMRFRFT